MTGERVEVRFDTDRVRSSLRWSRWTLAVSLAAAGAALFVVVTYLAAGNLFISIVTGALLAALVLFGVLPLILSTRNEICRVAGDGTGIALGVSREGIHTDVLPTVPWCEVLAVQIIDIDPDARARAERRLKSWGVPGWGARIMRRSGFGFQRLRIVLPEYKPYQARVTDPARRKAIGWWSGGTADLMGTLEIPTDPLIAESERELVLDALWRFAREAGVDIRRHSSAASWMAHLQDVKQRRERERDADVPPVQGREGDFEPS